jgi:hypothetical protein
MHDPFESARRKITRAGDYVTELERQYQAFVELPPYEQFSEPHPQFPERTIHKVRLARPLPEQFSDIAGDAVGYLREALDHAMFAVAIAAGCQHPRNAYFPFSSVAAGFEANLKGRCKDVPQQIYPLLRGFQPYQGGNEILFALNQIANRNKHALVTPIMAATFETGVSIRGTGFWSMPQPHIWDCVKNEMELFTNGPGAEFQGQIILAFAITLGDIAVEHELSALGILEIFLREVERVVAAIEAEARRLGFCQ